MPQSTPWTKRDKIAGLGCLVLFGSYMVPLARTLVSTAVNTVFGPLASILPFHVVILVVAMVTSLYSVFARDIVTDAETLEAAHQKMAELQKQHDGTDEDGTELDTETMRENQQAAMDTQLTILKLQFRPLVWVFLFTLPVFIWLSWKVSYAGGSAAVTSTVVLPLIGETAWSSPVFGFLQTWLVFYILCSIAFTQLIQKTVGIGGARH